MRPERTDHQAPQLGALLERQARQHVGLVRGERLLGAGHRLAAGRSDLDDVTAPIQRIAATRGQAVGLELVEDDHEVVGVGAHQLGQGLLGETLVAAQEPEGEEVAHRDAHLVLVAAAEDPLAQLGQQQPHPRYLVLIHAAGL